MCSDPSEVELPLTTQFSNKYMNPVGSYVRYYIKLIYLLSTLQNSLYIAKDSVLNKNKLYDI